MGDVAIFFGIAFMFAAVLIFAVRVPVFRSSRVRLIAIVTLGTLVVIGFAVGSFWSSRAADDEAERRVQTLRRELTPYQVVPRQVLTDDFSATLPAGTDARSLGDGVDVHSEVKRLWVYRCVQARVSAAGVTITTTNEKCHW